MIARCGIFVQRLNLGKMIVTDMSNHIVRRRQFGDNLGVALLLRLAVIVFVLVFLWLNPYQKSYLNMGLGAMLLFATLQPLDRWLRHRGPKPLPLLELHLVFYALCFGVAAFVTPTLPNAAIHVNESQYTSAIIATLLAVFMLRLGYALPRDSAGSFLARLRPRFDADSKARLLLVIYPSALAGTLLVKYAAIEALIQPVQAIRLFCFISLFCWVLTGKLGLRDRLWVYLLIVPLELLLFAGIGGGQLFSLLFYGELMGTAYTMLRGRVPVVSVIAIAAVFLLLQPVKAEYRDISLAQGRQLGPVQSAELFLTLGVRHYLGHDTGPGMGLQDAFDNAYSRIDDLQTTAAIMRDTPSVQPYRYGSTLIPLLTKWVPRAVWPTKPVEDMGNSWAREYGYLAPNDYVTSYNLPWLPEMYMNFGWFGVAGLSLLIGWLIRMIVQSAMFAVPSVQQFAFTLVIGSSFFWPESNLSLVLGGVVISWITLYLFAMVLQWLGSPSVSSASPT